MCSKCSEISGTKMYACPSFPRQRGHREETPQDRQASDFRKGTSSQLVPDRKAPAAMGLPGWDGRQDQQHGGRRQILRVPFGTDPCSLATVCSHEAKDRPWLPPQPCTMGSGAFHAGIKLRSALLPTPHA